MLWTYLTTHIVHVDFVTVFVPAILLVALPILFAGMKIIFTNTGVVDVEYHIGSPEIAKAAKAKAEEEYKLIYGGTGYGTGNKEDKHD